MSHHFGRSLTAALLFGCAGIVTPRLVAAQGTVGGNAAGMPSKTDAPRRKPTTTHVQAANERAAGEYLTTVGGCNDCHTSGWAESNGRTPQAERFTGSPVGFRGPWGVSYPANLRLMTQRESEKEWVRVLTTADGGDGKPPMPWMNTAQMSDRDLRVMYRYIRSLGKRGEPAPRSVPPDSEPRGPYINFVPVTPPR